MEPPEEVAVVEVVVAFGAIVVDSLAGGPAAAKHVKQRHPGLKIFS